MAKHMLFIVPTDKYVELNTVANRLMDSFKQKKIKASKVSAIAKAQEFLPSLAFGNLDMFLEAIIEQCNSEAEKSDVIVIEGITCDERHPYFEGLNKPIAQMLGGKIVFITTGSLDNDFFSFIINSFKSLKKQWLGCILHESSKLLSPNKIKEIEKGLSMNQLSLLSRMSSTQKHDQYSWLTDFIKSPVKPHLSPIVFQHQLVEQAFAANKHIVLPEGKEPRTLCAAQQCVKKKIARITLLGKKNEILSVAKSQDITLDKDIQIIEPKDIYDRYVDLLVDLRRHKGMTYQLAKKALQDHVMLGTMMLYNGDVDGLVSGAVHSTADTVRPALQVIKKKSSVELVSSIFFMCLPELTIYADCAINPNPTMTELGDIAIQSANTAKTFGICPRIAMISYASGTSAQGEDIDKVREAVLYVKEKRPDLLIDGPLQYDAASVPNVAKKKVPNSPLGGQANVFIFPNLNTGNTTYKAVQRSAHIVSIGPVLQGLNKPVNDLSRGCSVKDIVYTIAVTAIQAQ